MAPHIHPITLETLGTKIQDVHVSFGSDSEERWREVMHDVHVVKDERRCMGRDSVLECVEPSQRKELLD